MIFFRKLYTKVVCIPFIVVIFASSVGAGETAPGPMNDGTVPIKSAGAPDGPSEKPKFAKPTGGSDLREQQGHGDGIKQKLPPTRELSDPSKFTNGANFRWKPSSKETTNRKLPPTRELSNFITPTDGSDLRQQQIHGETGKQKLPATREFSGSSVDVKNEEKPPGETTLRTDIGIPLVFNDAVERYINHFSTADRDLFKRWLKNKRRYESLVRKILKDYGLPEDLVYLAMIESGFNLQAHSSMDADGPWQFIPETGRRYGLTVNHWIDERRDIQKSTVAAARYLQELFGQFDCWYLAAAAYNAGENRIDRLMKKHDTRDFWQLRTYKTLPRETREYVPRLIATAILSKNPEKYGLEDIGHVAPLRFVAHDVPGGVPLTEVAKAASTDVTAVKTLNPELLMDITPPGKVYRVKLPSKTNTKKFRISLTFIMKRVKQVVGVVDHIVKEQDDMTTITRQYGVSTDDLVMVNVRPLELKIGEPLYVPRFAPPKKEQKLIAVKTAKAKGQLRKGVTRMQPG